MLSYRTYKPGGPWYKYELNLNRTKIYLAVQAYLREATCATGESY